jgi:spore coat protein CotH
MIYQSKNATTEQTQYIEGVFNKHKTMHDNDLEDGYKTVIDVPLLILCCVNELCSNSDVYQSSTFFHKDRDGKLRAGPVWDFNLSLGSTANGDSQVDQWQFNNGNRIGPPFWTYSIMKILDVIYRSDGTKSKQQSAVEQGCSNCVFDNALNYISEAIP